MGRGFRLKKNINLIYWHDTPNFGDLLSPYIVSKLTDVKINHKKAALSFENVVKYVIKYPYRIHKLRDYVLPWQKNLLGCGSVLNLGNSKSQIWGSGFMNKTDDFFGGEIHALRGKYSEDKVKQMGGKGCSVYGDPALLLPLIYSPKIEKSHKVGIIPHRKEFDSFSLRYNQYHLIDLRTDNIESVIDDILSCEKILSTSLHGIIVSHAYGIPALWIKMTDADTDGIKFYDYFSSVGIEPYKGYINIAKILSSFYNIELFFKQEETKSFPPFHIIEKLRHNLLSVAPFPLKQQWRNE